jgi:hypothetical protein
MGRIMLLTLLAALAGGLLAVSGAAMTSSAGEPAPAAFRLADGSAGCVFDGSQLACSSRTGATVVLDEDGSSRPADESVDWDASTPVLRRAESWWHGGFGCRVDDDDIVCERDNGSIDVSAGGVGGASSISSDG